MISGAKDVCRRFFCLGIPLHFILMPASSALPRSFARHPGKKNERVHVPVLFRNSNNAARHPCTGGSGRLGFEVVFFLVNDHATADDGVLPIE